MPFHPFNHLIDCMLPAKINLHQWFIQFIAELCSKKCTAVVNAADENECTVRDSDIHPGAKRVPSRPCFGERVAVRDRAVVCPAIKRAIAATRNSGIYGSVKGSTVNSRLPS